MSRFTELKHFREDSGFTGFSLGLIYNQSRRDLAPTGELAFECFMIVSVDVTDGLPGVPRYVDRNSPYSIADHMQNECGDLYLTGDVERARPIFTGKFDFDNWTGITFDSGPLYFYCKEHWLAFTRLFARLEEIAVKLQIRHMDSR